MFDTSELLAKDSPLACAWLAANLEKKLTKQQLLNASVEESTKAVEDGPMADDASSSQANVEPMALRLSGQLLYGIVRIYSRKAKYLYEDASDILMKLKAAFATSKSVILPVGSTTMPSMKHVTLSDTVTEADILYNEPVDFDALMESRRGTVPRYSQIAEDTEPETFPVADESIEVGRQPVDELDNEDNELDLNFDLEPIPDVDESVEVGRAAEANVSAMDTMGEIELPDFHEPILDAGLEDDEPLNEPATPEHEPVRRRLPAYSTTGVVRTNRRKIKFDSVTELSADALRDNQRDYMDQEVEEQEETDEPIDDSFVRFAESITKAKRRRLDAEESRTPEITQDLEPIDYSLNDIDVAPQSPVEELNVNLDEVVPDEPIAPPPEEPADEEADEFDSQPLEEKATAHIADCLNKLVLERGTVTFNEVVEEDTVEPLSEEPKKEAGRAFFELLVLAGNDAIKLDQTRLFGDIQITAKEGLSSYI